MANDIDDQRVYIALREIATNAIRLANMGFRKHPHLEVVSFFATTTSGNKQAEIIIHGVEEKDLCAFVSLCNSHYFHTTTMFGKGMGTD